MPIKINMYACDFRCGFVRSKKRAVVKHELNCSSNPARKGCKTCKHFRTSLNSNGMEGPYRHEWLEAFCDKDNFGDTGKNNPQGMRFNCNKWVDQSLSEFGEGGYGISQEELVDFYNAFKDKEQV